MTGGTLQRNRPATGARGHTAAAELERLIARFDPGVIDVRGSSARIRLVVEGEGEWDAPIEDGRIRLEPARGRPDAVLRAERPVWAAIASDIRGGMDAFRGGRLSVRQNLHLGVGFLAATCGNDEPGRLRFERVKTGQGELSILRAGAGEPLICLHGLGGTKASFLPTVAALASERREVIALDLPGFGDSAKPLTAAYDARYFAATVIALMDALGIERADLAGNSMGGRVTLEAGFRAPDRVRRSVLLSPALAWLRERPLKWLLQLPVARLGLIQPAPKPIADALVRSLVPGGNDGWAAAGVDEFLRAYCDPRGRAAFYAAASNIYLDEPYGVDGLWTRLKHLAPETLFVWGRHDKLVPIAFMRHVERALPAARHLELNCGHVPQLERPRETHEAMERFLSGR